MAESGSRLLQYAAASTGNLNIMTCGAILGWTSPILPKLSADNPIAPDNQLLRPITKDEGSWIGSLVPLGVMFGSIFSGYLAERLGRKRALLISTFPFLIGWILVGTAKNIIQMYVGRFTLGLGVAIPFTVLPMYIGEIAEVPIRGTLGSLLQLFITCGFLFSYSIGPYVPYTVFWLLCASLHLAFFVCFALMPESPYFLLAKGRGHEAAEALARFRGKSATGVQKEIEEIQTELDYAFREKTSWKDVFRVKVNLKAIVLTSILMCFQEFMGIDVVLFYVEDIFRDAGTKNTAVSAIMVGFVQMFASIVTPIVVDKSGRKILLIISSIGCFITLGLLGMYFYLKKIEYDLSSMTWVPLPTLIFYIVSFSLGWGPLPWTIMGEMFAPGVKPRAASICVFSLWTFSFVLTKLFANVEQSYGAHVGFWFFAACCVANVFYIVLLFPETKGKTLMQIQEELSAKTTTSTEATKSPRIVAESAVVNSTGIYRSKIMP